LKELRLSERGFKKYCENKSVVCFGAGAMFREAAESLGIAASIEFVLDNSIKKHDTSVYIGSNSYRIYHVSRMPKLPENAVLLVTSKYFLEIKKQIEEDNTFKNVETAFYPMLKLYTPEDEFYDVRVNDSAIKIYREFCVGKRMSEEATRENIQSLKAYMSTKLPSGTMPFVMPRLVYIMSSVCTLKCRNCLALMPLYKEPAHVCVKQILRDIKITLNAVDKCVGVELIGGETFLYPELAEVLKLVLDNEKVLSVILSTNGTIIPGAELTELLKSPKLWIRMSDYKVNGEEVKRTAEYFLQSGIEYDLIKSPEWKDGGGTEYRRKSAKEISQEFLNCENGRVTKTVYDGRIFVCPRSARLYSLGLYSSENDYVELCDDDIIKTREKLLAMQLKDKADACQYCDFGSLYPRLIPSGEQV
jgi:organic radical activating enzyme